VVFNLELRPSEGREPFQEWLREDILCTQLHYICFAGVLDAVRWVVTGCCNGSRYKKGWKPQVEHIHRLLFCSNKHFIFKRLL